MQPEPDSVELKGDFTVEDARRFYFFHVLPKQWWMYVVAVGAIGLAFAMTSVVSPMPWFLLFFLLFFSILVPHRAASKSMGKYEESGRPVALRFDAEGLHSEGAEMSGRMAWSAVERVYETNSLYILYVGPAAALRVPKHFFPTAEIEQQFRKVLRKYVANDKFLDAGFVGNWT